MFNGIITPGQDIDGETKIEFNKIPTDLRGKTVLDIGAWDGLFLFEAERVGRRACDHGFVLGRIWKRSNQLVGF